MGKRMLRNLSYEADDLGVEFTLAHELHIELLQFGAVGQLPEPEQVADFFKVGMIGEFVDVDAAIGKNTLVAVDVTDAGISGNYTFESLGGLRR